MSRDPRPFVRSKSRSGVIMKLFVWDTETTGINPQVDRLVEIACIQVSESPTIEGTYFISQSYEAYVNPERDIPPEAKAVHHITEKMVANAPVASRVLADMLSYLKIDPGDIFVAHNARFDRGFLKMIDSVVEKSLTHICTMKCAKVIWPDAPGYSNQFLRYYLNLEPAVPEGMGPHRALYDIIVTAAIFYEELKYKTLEELIEISNVPVLLKKMPLGKHKGVTFDKVPLSYLRWILSEPEGSFDEDLIYTTKYWMKRS